ncbi:ribonuclease T2 [Rhizoclosmatium globosum]|uniref:Ribonuclease T2 n=1 Tax=Rhizoclosmatium globosum TaxID=329046 RepID=A0A1Y2C9A0_9FUNG|nr:ribonuclease T2 [Rhizoclosmatium globosum]|eukprot:ORY43610.1 ribonuclease T2 [Rhizoclosmatium globosum]
MIFSLLSAAALAQAMPLDALFGRVAPSCSVNAVACQGKPNVCCVPSNGKLVLSIQWLPGWCAANNCAADILPSAPEATWSIHGLWPDTCAGTQPPKNGCDNARQYQNINDMLTGTAIYDDLVKYWISYKGTDIASYNSFWVHEWGVHGTCYSTANTACVGSNGADVLKFFSDALAVRQKFDVYSALWNAGIKPDGNTYNTDDMTAAIQSAFPGVNVQYLCTGDYVNEMQLSLIGVGGGQIAKPQSYPLLGSNKECGATVIYAEGPNGVVPPSNGGGVVPTKTTTNVVIPPKTTDVVVPPVTTPSSGAGFAANCPRSPCEPGNKFTDFSCDPTGCLSKIAAADYHCGYIGWKKYCVGLVSSVCGLDACA